MKRYFFPLFCLLLLVGCADKVTCQQAAEMVPVGFWYGVWHGMTEGVAFIGSLFDPTIAIYATYNNGHWYDFGFVGGLGLILSAISGLYRLIVGASPHSL
jgi:hypothetical protein